MRGKKGQVLNGLGALGIAIASFTILMAVLFLVVAQVQDQIVDTQGIANESSDGDRTVAYNASVILTKAAADIPGWVPLIVIVTIGGLILGMVTVFGRK